MLLWQAWVARQSANISRRLVLFPGCANYRDLESDRADKMRSISHDGDADYSDPKRRSAKMSQLEHSNPERRSSQEPVSN